MKKIILAFSLAFSLAATSHAKDEKSVKFEAGGGFISYGESQSIGVLGRANLTIPIVDRAFDIGVEVEGSTSIDNLNEQGGFIDTIDGVPTEVFLSLEDFGVQDHVAGFFLFRVPLDSGLGISARAGYFSGNFGGSLTTEIPALETTTVDVLDLDFEGVALGLAGEYFFGSKKKNGVRLDVTWYDNGDLDIDQGSTWTSISYMRRF